MPPLSERQKHLANLRQKRFYQRNKEKILLKNKQDRLTIKRLIEQTSTLELQDIADTVAQPVHAIAQLHFDLSTLISLFEREKDNVHKNLSPQTVAKHVSELRNLYRILDLDKKESLIKYLTANPELTITTLLDSKQIKDPSKPYAISVQTGRLTTILYALDISLRTVIDHRTVEIMRLAKKEYKSVVICCSLTLAGL